MNWGAILRYRWLVAALSAIGYLLVAWQAAMQVQQTAVDALAASGHSQLNLYATHLRGELQRFEKLPTLIATHPRLLEVLQDPDDVDAVDGLNRYLEEINRSTGAADTYLMDRNGLTLAASNWHSERPFVGRNFNFRPYFQEAMAGQLGRYFAQGTASQQRGYYFASSVRAGGKVFGVVVVKVNLSNIEQEWEGLPEEVVVTDPDGVIFFATQPTWRFKTIAPLDHQARTRIELSRRYPKAALEPLPLKAWVPEGTQHQLVQLGDNQQQRYLLQSQAMAEAGWQVHLMTPLQSAHQQMVNAILLISALALALLFLGLGLRQRYKRRLEKMLYDEQAREALYRTHAQLEQRVKSRTADLSESNEQLSREIEERRHAEAQLRATQNELIQAAKLATLGQMSAGINHELSQPLAAIRSYADNGQALLEKGRLQEVESNLVQISDLTERMARIGSQLKIFSRKSTGLVGAVSLKGVIEAARAIIGPRSNKTDATLIIALPDERLQVCADEGLVQQVLVNLIHNALQAVEGEAERKVEVHTEQRSDQVALVVEDSGPGIADEHLEHIFDPFFTTKEASEGLGLGLTISNRIVTELGGEMSASSGCLGGARFEVVLPSVESGPESELESERKREER